MKNVLKRCSLFLAVPCAIAFTCISATESDNLISDFNAAISGKDPLQIKTNYDIYIRKPTDKANQKNSYNEAVLAELIDWINRAALLENFGGYTIKELKKHLKQYVPNNNKQEEIIKEILLVRTLFYPTKNTVDKEKLKNKFTEWKKWLSNKSTPCYDLEDTLEIDIIKINNNLSILGFSGTDNLHSIKLLGEVTTYDFCDFLTNYGETPTKINNCYIMLNQALKNDYSYQLPALNQLINWINWAAPRKDFGGYTHEELEIYLKQYLSNEASKDCLLVRRLFYPTEEEVKAIENNTNGLKDTVIKNLKYWMQWHKEHPCFYNKEDIDTKHLKEILNRLGNGKTVANLKLLKGNMYAPKTKIQTVKKTKKEVKPIGTPVQSTYFKPVVITLSVIAMGIVSFWAFKKFCPQYSAKLSLLFKLPRLWSRTPKVSQLQHNFSYAI
ncbi:MAG: hypothetical protein UV38_C0004G0001 [candidate division TM6 bacterium GW2011_GWE2_42_60]|nr:MAG: hypothetical protein UV38_C0004G0001 [candidate division TM6 bacterium GW2011_GWE2_42_60]HBY05878.1 hypothetical protein [Candidatus Dependentiae bacterium]